MRIATSQSQALMNRALAQNQNKITELTAQMASGAKLQAPSDDPVTNVRISRLMREEAQVGQYRANIDAVKIGLQKNEAYLGSMVGDINEARDLVVWALDGGNTPEDLQSMVNSMSSLRDSLFYNANTKDPEGRYIFSGTLSSTPALTFDASAPAGSRYTYTGNEGQQQVVVGNGIAQTTNTNLSGLETLLNQMDSTLEAFQTPGASPADPALRATLVAHLEGSDETMRLISGKIADIGGAQNILSTLGDNLSNVSLSNQKALTDLGQLDYGLAATELNGYNIALQSTYKAYAKVSSLSLFNLL
ncbi:MAG: flagellar hook-associated protein FlgL [Pseudomonadota bacterium]